MQLDPQAARAWAPYCLAAGGALALLVLFVTEAAVGAVSPRLEGLFLDAAFRLREELGWRPPADPRLAPLRISRKSTERFGRWPWPRGLHTELLDAHWETLAVRGVVMDILFRGESEPREDAAFARFLASRPEVALGVGVGMTRRAERRLELGPLLGERPALARHLLPTRDPPRGPPWVRRLSTPLTQFTQAAGGLGHISGLADADKVYRRFRPFVQVEDRLLPSLGLIAACKALRLPLENVGLEGGALVMKAGGELPETRRFALDADGALAINWVAPYGQAFPPVYAHDLAEPATPELRRRGANRVWIYGVATLAVDMGPTPLQNDEIPLMATHLHAANTLVTGRVLRRFGWPLTAALALAFLAALVAVGTRCAPLRGALLGTFVVAAFPGMGFALFLLGDRLVPMARGSIFLGGAYLGLLGFYLLVYERARQRTRDGFRRYFPAEVVDGIMSHPEGPRLGGRRAELTILFSDLKGFTAVSERVEPEVLAAFLAAYFERMVEIVFAHGGTVDKFMGDGLLAFWGDPVPVPDHADRALAAARAMQVAAREVDKVWADRLGAPVQLRVGVNTGEVIVGNMGGRQRMEYTVLGRAVNLAQRLEAGARPGGILLGAGTVTRLTQRPADLRRREVMAKGFGDPVVAYEVPPFEP